MDAVIVAVLALAGCVRHAPGDTVANPEDVPPAITGWQLRCDVDAEEWQLQADTDAWTGGGRLYWTADGRWYESHYVRSQSAAADGTADHLLLELSIVGDWRDQSSGSSTVIRCTDTPAARFVVYARDGQTITDCRNRGDQGLLAGMVGIAPCDADSDSDTDTDTDVP